MTLQERIVLPEVLDGLPAEDPAAVRSRRDLLRINRLMSNAGTLAGLLRRSLPAPPRRVLEIGAGDGATGLDLARRLAAEWPGATMLLLDRLDLVTEERRRAFAALGWQAEPVVADIFDWFERTPDVRFDAVITTLFLHHFDASLPRLLAVVARAAPVFVAAEPRRSRPALAASRLLGAIGANAVTRHDAVVSVRAGFAGNELSELWPERNSWRLEERRRGLFTHAFAAVRPDR